MLGDVIAIETVPIGGFHEPQALFVKFGQLKVIAIDPIEDTELDRRFKWRVRSLILRLGDISLNPFRVFRYHRSNLLGIHSTFRTRCASKSEKAREHSFSVSCSSSLYIEVSDPTGIR